MSDKPRTLKQAAPTPSNNGSLPTDVSPCWPEPPERLVIAAVRDVPEALLTFGSVQADDAADDLAYRIAFADDVLGASEDAGPERRSQDMTALCPLIEERLKDQALGSVPIIVPALHGFTPWPALDPRRPVVLVRDLVRRLQSVGDHIEAAAAWAVHGCVRQRLLGIGVPWHVRIAQVGGLYPNSHPNWHAPELEPVTGEGEAADFASLAVWATPALWEWWRLSSKPVPVDATPTAKPRPPADKVAYAVALRARHLDWTDAQIAREVGVNRTTLYSWEKYKSAKAALEEAAKDDLPRGHKCKDGTVEAYDEQDDGEFD